MRVGILGAGRMAAGFDAPGAPRVLTLAHAVTRSSVFELGGFFDTVAGRAASAEAKWRCQPSPRDREAWLDAGWDVVCIATPDAEHARDLGDVLARKPRGVVVEKPLALDCDEGLRLLDRADALGVPVVVDFPRRWHSAVAALARDVAEDRLGQPRAAAFAYSGTAARAASHMLDLFQRVWGDWNVAAATNDRGASPLIFRRGSTTVPATFIELPAPGAYVWELHVYCERGKVELSHSPEILEVSGVGPHADYPGFSVLTPRGRHAMENEPLLSRMLDCLAAAISDADAARTLLRAEQAGQRFTGAVLRALGAA
jgi:predicted dehydrogenase